MLKVNYDDLKGLISEDDLLALKLRLRFEEVDHSTSDNEGNTLLHNAICKRNFILTNLLLERRANPSAQNKDGNTPLHLAVDKDYHLLKLLLKNGADTSITNSDGYTPLQVAVKANKHDAIKKLSPYAGVSEEDRMLDFDTELDTSDSIECSLVGDAAADVTVAQ